MGCHCCSSNRALFALFLMTTAAMVLGVIPLVMATGAGAASRFNIGLVITTGISIGTCFTLFVVPAMYLLIAKTVKPSTNTSKRLIFCILHINFN